MINEIRNSVLASDGHNCYFLEQLNFSNMIIDDQYIEAYD